MPDLATRELEQWITAAVIVVVGVSLSFVARRAIQRLLRRGEAANRRLPVDATATSLVARITQASMLAFSAVYALFVLGIRVGPLLAALGVGGIAVAFALRDTLENLIAGLVLQIRRPFVIGDQVQIGASEGRIVDVGFRYVQIARPDGTVALHPARRVLDDVIVNTTTGAARRATLTVSLPHDRDLSVIRQRVRHAVDEAPSVLVNPPSSVLLAGVDHGEAGVLVRFWHDPSEVDAAHVVDEILAGLHTTHPGR